MVAWRASTPCHGRVLHFDGLHEPRGTDRGIATHGFLVTKDGELAGEGRGLLAGPGGPLASANVAEFGALIQGLAWIRDHKREPGVVVVRGDSRLVIATVAGTWNLTAPHLVPLRDAAREISRAGGVERFEKVRRGDDADADRLARLAYNEHAAAHPEWRPEPWAPSTHPSRAAARL